MRGNACWLRKINWIERHQSFPIWGADNFRAPRLTWVPCLLCLSSPCMSDTSRLLLSGVAVATDAPHQVRFVKHSFEEKNNKFRNFCTLIQFYHTFFRAYFPKNSFNHKNHLITCTMLDLEQTISWPRSFINILNTPYCHRLIFYIIHEWYWSNFKINSSIYKSQHKLTAIFFMVSWIDSCRLSLLSWCMRRICRRSPLRSDACFFMVIMPSFTFLVTGFWVTPEISERP